MSWLSKVVKKNLRGTIRLAGKVVGGAIGGPAGVALATATVLATKRAPTSTVYNPTPYNPPGIQIGGTTINPPFFGPPGVGIGPTGPRAGRVQPGANGECPKGYHLDKRTRSFCVRNRRTNYANGRAAARAGRRLRGTVKMLRKSFSLVQAKAPKGKFIPKGRGKR